MSSVLQNFMNMSQTTKLWSRLEQVSAAHTHHKDNAKIAVVVTFELQSSCSGPSHLSATSEAPFSDSQTHVVTVLEQQAVDD
jgi:hypothetical protein